MLLRFADCLLDAERRELRRGDDPVRVEPQVFDLLIFLVENRDRVVTKDDLFASVWHGRIVSEATLSSRINAVRRAIGDTGEQQCLLRTVHRHGFRFVAEVTQVDASASARPQSPPPAGEALEGSRPRPLPDKPSIAVLPFTNMSGDPEQEHFADGLVDDILTSLSKVSELFVVARNSTFVFKGKAVDPREVAKLLGVRYVVEGSVRRSGSRLRIAAQLIDGQTASHVWAERYDRSIEDIFDVQDDITREITTALQVRLTEGEQVELRRRQTSNLPAWEAFARGQTHLRTFTMADNIEARRFFERALTLDSNFAAAWALLAWTYLMEGRLGWSKSSQKSLEKGADAALRGLAISENGSDAWSMLGGIRVYQRRYEEALEAGQRSIELAPSAADHLVIYALTLNFVGRPQEAVTLIQRAMRLSPFYPDFYLGLIGISYRLLGRIHDAIAVDLKRLERNPENVFSDLRLVALYSQSGDMEKGRAHLREALRKNPSYSVRQVRITDPYQDEAEMERYLNLLRAVGLPE